MHSLIIWEEITPKQMHARLLLRKERNDEDLPTKEDCDFIHELFKEDDSFQLWMATAVECGYQDYGYSFKLVFDEDQATPDADQGWLAAFQAKEDSRSLN